MHYMDVKADLYTAFLLSAIAPPVDQSKQDTQLFYRTY
jgi:hypothetical protein